MKDYKLCYVDGNFAYFTTQDINKQWGDDWDDIEYENNAGEPYEPCWHRENGKKCDCKACKTDWNTDGSPKWEIMKVAFDVHLVSPCEHGRWSVEDINSGKVAWLSTNKWNDVQVVISAGVSIDEFDKLITKAGGSVYYQKRHFKIWQSRIK